MTDVTAAPPEQISEEEAPLPTRRLLVFEVGGAAFACDMESVREIFPPSQITRLPGAPDSVCGLINLRGAIVTVLDAGICLQKSGCARTGGLVLLVDYGEKLIGVGVDDVRDIQDATIDQLVEASPTESLASGVVTGALELEGERIPVLDIKAVVREVIG